MDNAIINTCPSILLISYDNDLRGDDAAGLRVSDAIARICSEGFPPENPLPELSSGQDAFSILGHRAGEAIAQGAAPFGSIATWNLQNVRLLSIHQLTPELAEILAKVDIAIFVDAYPATAQQDVVSSTSH